MRIAVGVPFPPDDSLAERLREIDPSAEVVFTPYAESMAVRAHKGVNAGRLVADLELPEIDQPTRDLWAETDVFVGVDVPDAHAELLPQLGWFQSAAAGLDNIDTVALAERNVVISTASGVAAESIAEFVMARFLQHWKHLRTFDNNQLAHDWKQRYGVEVKGKTLLIVGFGAIGAQVALRAKAFGMNVLATRRSAKPGDVPPPNVNEMHPAAQLPTVLPRADAVVACLPGSPETVDFFDADMFANMKPGALFQNVGRGSQVDEVALVAALESGQLGAAILDVTKDEPVLADSPLWDAPNLYLSPHSAISVDRYAANTFDLLVENFALWRAGEPLRNQY